MKRLLSFALLVITILWGDAGDVSAESPNDSVTSDSSTGSLWDRFRDPVDGKFDIAANQKASGVLPLLIPFNDPAVGIGVVGAVAYLHPVAAPPSGQSDQGSAVPPSITFGGGAYTENTSWAGAIGHLGVWKQGRIRYLGAAAYASVNLRFYGIGRDSARSQNPISYNIKGLGTAHQLQFQLGHSRFFLGGRYELIAADVSFDSLQTTGEEGQSTNAGITGKLSYDDRDNVFTPNRGAQLAVDASYFGEALGGDFQYGGVSVGGKGYVPLGQKVVLGLRADVRAVGGGAPFYALPFIKQRGIPAFRYLGNYVVSGEIEPRWKVDDRWSLLAFVGAGRAAVKLDRLDDAERAYGYGAGFRYLMARKLGLAAGLDYARGPEESVVYITLGSAW